MFRAPPAPEARHVSCSSSAGGATCFVLLQRRRRGMFIARVHSNRIQAPEGRNVYSLQRRRRGMFIARVHSNRIQAPEGRNVYSHNRQKKQQAPAGRHGVGCSMKMQGAMGEFFMPLVRSLIGSWDAWAINRTLLRSCGIRVSPIFGSHRRQTIHQFLGSR